MIDFEKAIRTARENVTKLVPQAKNLILEGAIISSDDKLYEIIFSYENNSITDEDILNPSKNGLSNLQTLAMLMGKRRETKIFLVDKKDGKFRGFKKYKDQ